MNTETRYFVRYKFNAKRITPYDYEFGNHVQSFTMRCPDKNNALIQCNVMNYDNVKHVMAYSKTYAKIFNILIPIKKTKLFVGNIK